MGPSSGQPSGSELAPEGVAVPEPDDGPRTGLRDLEEQTALGEFYLRALMRRQLRLSLGLALTFAAFLGVQPLLSWFWHPYTQLKLLGIPCSWLILGLLSYPLMIWLGSLYVRRAEEVDDEFTDLLR